MKPLVLTGHERPLTYIQFNPDGDILFSCGKDGFLNCWILMKRRSDGSRYPQLSMKRLGRYNTCKAVVSNCDISLDGTQLIATSADSKLYIFEVATGRELFSSSEKGPVRFAEWNRKPLHHDKFVLSQDGFSNKSKPALKVYMRKKIESEFENLLSIGDITSKCTRVHWGPYDETLISTHDDGSIYVWDAETGEKLKEIKAHSASITDVDFTDGRLLMLTSSLDTTGKLWNTQTFELVKTYQTDRPLNSCAISPLWNSEENPRPHVAFGGGQSAERVALSAQREGRFQALIYHMVYGHQLCSLGGHFSPINHIRFFPDGMGFATAAEEGKVRVVQFDDDYFKMIEV